MSPQSSSSIPLLKWMRPQKQLEKIRLVQGDTFNDLETNSNVLPGYLLSQLHDEWRRYQDDTADYENLSTLQLLMRNGSISTLKEDVRLLNSGTKRASEEFRSRRLASMIASKRSSVETLELVQEVDPEVTIFGSELPTPKNIDFENSRIGESPGHETSLLDPADEMERLMSLDLGPDVDIFRDSDEYIISKLSAPPC